MAVRWPAHRATFALVALVLLFILSSVDAAVLSLPGDAHFQIQHKPLPTKAASPFLSAREPLSCGFPGNPDIYGLGIRLGLYLLWTSTILTYELLADEVSSAVDTNVVFFLSVGVATVVLSSQSPHPYAEEIFVLLSIFFGGFYSLAFPSKADSFSVWGLMLRGYLLLAMSGYSVWFWFRGIAHMHTQPEGCTAEMFLFARVGLLGPARRFFQAISVINIVFVGMLLLFAELFCGLPGVLIVSIGSVLVIVVLIWECLTGKGKDMARSIRKGFRDPENRTMLLSLFAAFSKPMLGMSKEVMKNKVIPAGEERKRTQPIWRRYPWWNIALLIWTILAIELTLRWNKVGNVHSISSTGQLIPFVTGIAGLLNVLYRWVAERVGRSRYNTGLLHVTDPDDNYELFPRKVGPPVKIKKDSECKRRQSW